MEAEPSGEELIRRYKKHYNISGDEIITEQMILKHWNLEKSLTKRLLNSTEEDRWATFEECYIKLYGELEWLNISADTEDQVENTRNWVNLIGDPPQKIYEVGSGKGELISYLADLGYKCKATEITRHRGEKHVSEHPNLSWGISDGIHLDKFEERNYYDVVISNQVIEHLHPDDLTNHFKGVFSILSSGGKYIFTTPHKFVGPYDISRVFKRDEPVGMHLKEYTYAELERTLLQETGFEDVQAVVMITPKYRKIGLPYINPRKSSRYLHYLVFMEKCISFFRRGRLSRMSPGLLMFGLFFYPNITLICRKK